MYAQNPPNLTTFYLASSPTLKMIDIYVHFYEVFWSKRLTAEFWTSNHSSGNLLIICSFSPFTMLSSSSCIKPEMLRLFYNSSFENSWKHIHETYFANMTSCAWYEYITIATASLWNLRDINSACQPRFYSRWQDTYPSTCMSALLEHTCARTVDRVRVRHCQKRHWHRKSSSGSPAALSTLRDVVEVSSLRYVLIKLYNRLFQKDPKKLEKKCSKLNKKKFRLSHGHAEEYCCFGCVGC